MLATPSEHRGWASTGMSSKPAAMSCSFVFSKCRLAPLSIAAGCYPVTNPDAIRVIREAAMLVPIR